MSSQNKPTPHPQGAGGVCTGVAFAAAPPPSSATRRGGKTTHLASEPSLDPLSCCKNTVAFLCSLALTAWILSAFSKDLNDPSFQVQSVLISVNNNNNLKSNESQVTAVWNIGFSVKNSNWLSSFDYETFDIWVLFMSKESAVADIRPFRQDFDNTTFLHATVSASLPHQDFPPLIQGLEFEVMIRTTYDSRWRPYTVQAVCKDLRVGFSSNATKGIMVGGPISCPLVSHPYNF